MRKQSCKHKAPTPNLPGKDGMNGPSGLEATTLPLVKVCEGDFPPIGEQSQRPPGGNLGHVRWEEWPRAD